MKEYAIFKIVNGGCPYFNGVFSNFEQAKDSLEILISYEKEHNHTYFVDNDFFENEYPLTNVQTYFCLKEREVEKWIKITNDINILNKQKNNSKNKILNFEDYLLRKY